MKRVPAIVAVVASALVFAGGALGAKSVNTNVKLELFTEATGNLYAIGLLTAGDDRCVPDRTVEIYIVAPNKAPVYIDTARTANHGGWAGFRNANSLPNQQYTEAKLVVPKTTIKVSKKKRITCAGKTKVFPLAG